MLHLPGFYYVQKPKRFVILCSDKSSERNLSCFFDMRKPGKMEHLQKEEPFSSDLYFRIFLGQIKKFKKFYNRHLQMICKLFFILFYFFVADVAHF